MHLTLREGRTGLLMVATYRCGAMLLTAFLAVFMTFSVAAPAAAQAPLQAISTLQFAQWESLARRAELAIEGGRASDLAMETLRAELDDWRQTFNTAQSTPSVTVQSLKSQLVSLGAVPEGGEAEDIAEQRKALEAKLAEAEAPIRRAALAFNEAETLIKGVDSVLRSRQAAALFQLDPTPLNPARWPSGIQTLVVSLDHVLQELRKGWSEEAARAKARANWPRITFLLILGLVLIVRGRSWIIRLLISLSRHDQASASRRLVTFCVSLGQLFLPLGGIYALTEAAYATGFPGLRGDLLLSALPMAGFQLLLSFWLGARIFADGSRGEMILTLPTEKLQAGRVVTHLMGWCLATHTMLDVLATFDNWSTADHAVILFPVMAFAGFLLHGVGRLLKMHTTLAHQAHPEENRPTSGLFKLFAQLLMVVAIVGVVSAAIGYTQAANGILFPSILSLQLIAFLVLLQFLLVNIYTVVTRHEEGAHDSLLLVFSAFCLIVISLPLLALIWGARISDVQEVWTTISFGLSLGDSRISPTDFLMFVLVFAIGYALTRLIQGMLRNTVLPKTRIDKGGQNAIVSGTGYIGIVIAAIAAITTAGIDLGNIALVAGALSVGIGFGLQTVVSNFVSGIILLIERPIAEGDWIEVNGRTGYVRNISVRSTRIETFDRTDVIVPNADLISGAVVNYTRGNTIGRVIVPVGVAYGTDPRRVEKILRDIAEAHPMVLLKPAPSVVFQGFGDNSLNFEIRAILRDINWSLTVRSELNYEISRRFTEEKIEIPFVQRDLWLRNPEALNGAAPNDTATQDATVDRSSLIKPAQTAVHLTESDLPPSDTDGDADGGEK